MLPTPPFRINSHEDTLLIKSSEYIAPCFGSGFSTFTLQKLVAGRDYIEGETIWCTPHKWHPLNTILSTLELSFDYFKVTNQQYCNDPFEYEEIIRLNLQKEHYKRLLIDIDYKKSWNNFINFHILHSRLNDKQATLPLKSLFVRHCCRPNSGIVYNQDRARLFATRHIKMGEEITRAYYDEDVGTYITILPTIYRRILLVIFFLNCFF